MIRPSHLPYFLVCVIVGVACSVDSENADNSSADKSTKDASAGETYSDNCPTSQVFDQMTCVGSIENSTCEGREFCDSCGNNVAVACTCVAYSAGFHFECEPADCTKCENEDGGSTEEPWESVVACLIDSRGTRVCEEAIEPAAVDLLRKECRNNPDGSDDAVEYTILVDCPKDGSLGYCQREDGRLYAYGEQGALSLYQRLCEEEYNGTFHPLP